MIQVDLIIPRDHPSAAGHFPGNPIVPGALLLSEVMHVWEKHTATPLGRVTIKVAKFLSPTLPGDTVSVQFDSTVPLSVKFQCMVHGTMVLSGSFDYTPA